MSKRKDVLDAVVNGLAASTGIKTATQEARIWNTRQVNKLPLVTVMDEFTELEPMSFRETSTGITDSWARMDLRVQGVVHDFNNSSNDLATAINNLASDIESTMVTSTGIAAEVLHVIPRSIMTDNGFIDNYGLVECTFEVLYAYNHQSP